MKINFLENPKIIPIGFDPFEKGERTFVVVEEMTIVLSDGHVLIIPEGFKTDLISVPKWLWGVLRPFDKGLIGDLIHDALWVDQINQMKRFGGSYEARKFAEDERLKWRNKLVSNKKFKNYLTHYFLRIFGGLYYSRQIKIPN